jgi:steroid delta-isomerase-like uncharacterized protein
MSSKNVETVRAAHDSWNRRDFNGIVRDMADNGVYVDRARNLTLNKQKFSDWTRDWATAFSDGRIINANYVDAGDVVVAEFTVEGTNDGKFAGMPPTGRKVTFSYCEVTRLDQNGHTVSASGYYDLYTIMTQLGHIQPRATAA